MPQPTTLSDHDLYAIAERSLPAWGLQPETIELVSRSENTVFKLTLADGAAYALRIHRPGYHTLAELESEQRWMQALNEAGIRAPLGVPARDGRRYVTAASADGGEARVIGLVEWLAGELLGSVIERETDAERVAAHFREMGRMIAACHNQASGWTPPPGFTRHAFDVPGYVGEAPFWGRFWDLPILSAEQRAVLERARRGIAETMRAWRPDAEQFTMIHADLHAHNILVRADGALQLIDFDDAGFGWHQYDLAVALFGLDQRSDYGRIYESLLGGYRERRRLSAAAEARLPLFLLIRRLALIGWQWERPELGRRAGLAEWVSESCRLVEEFGF